MLYRKNNAVVKKRPDGVVQFEFGNWGVAFSAAEWQELLIALGDKCEFC